MFGATVTNGKFGNSYNFDGIDDYIEIPNSASLNSQYITIQAWIKPYNITSKNNIAIITKDDSNGGTCYFLAFQEYGTKLTFSINNHSENTTIAPSYLTDGNWHHVAGSFDGQYINLYIDGILKSTLSYNGTITSSNKPVLIEKQQSNEYFYGLIDEVVILNYAASVGTITIVYDTLYSSSIVSDSSIIIN